MKIGLIIFTFLLITIKAILCRGLGELEYAITNECPSQEDIPKCHCKVVAGGKKKIIIVLSVSMYVIQIALLWRWV